MRRLALATLLLAPACVLTAGQDDVFEKAFSMEGVSRISVENVNGRIEATAWDKPYLKVRAVKTATGSRSEETLAQTEIRVRKIGDEIRLETINPRRHHLFGFLDFGWHNPRVDYELHFPPGTTVRMETTNGQVQGSGFDGSVSCDVVNGSIELTGVGGPVRAATVNGGLRIAFRGPLKKSDLETVNGSVEVAFDRASSVRYDLQTVNGRIEGDIDLAIEGKHGPKEARGSYNGGSESLRCETVNGSIRLKTK
jgi:putative adhesin